MLNFLKTKSRFRIRKGILCLSLKASSLAKKIFLLSGASWNKSSFDIDIDYELIPYSHWLYAWIGIADKAPYYKFEPKPHKFCSLIGKDRWPREMFVANILKKFPTKDYILNYKGKMLAQDSTLLDNITLSEKEVVHKQGLNIKTPLNLELQNLASASLR